MLTSHIGEKARTSYSFVGYKYIYAYTYSMHIIPAWSDYGMKRWLDRQQRANTMAACLFTEKKSYSLIGHGEEYS